MLAAIGAFALLPAFELSALALAQLQPIKLEGTVITDKVPRTIPVFEVEVRELVLLTRDIRRAARVIDIVNGA